MNELDYQYLLDWHDHNKEKKLFGRRVIFEMIEPILKKLSSNFQLDQIGTSFNQIPIYSITVGTGKIKILFWSQMHGNESTGTKAIFDLFRFFIDSEIGKSIIKECTLVFIPMLNPDGALAYTRKNAQGIDLNRDAVDLKAGESKILRNVLTQFSPQFCFNLHDQRTIFSVGSEKLPATISFLAPSENEERTLTAGRKITMSVINAMNKTLQKIIANQVGRYTDEFYPTATGDNFQKEGYNTILIEAGNCLNDYEREIVRKYNFIALISGLHYIATETAFENYKPYFDIPNNEKYYLDVIFKNVYLSNKNKKTDVGIVFKEELVSNKIILTPNIKYIDDLSGYNANVIIEKDGEVFESERKLTELI